MCALALLMHDLQASWTWCCCCCCCFRFDDDDATAVAWWWCQNNSPEKICSDSLPHEQQEEEWVLLLLLVPGWLFSLSNPSSPCSSLVAQIPCKMANPLLVNAFSSSPRLLSYALLCVRVCVYVFLSLSLGRKKKSSRLTWDCNPKVLSQEGHCILVAKDKST